MKQAEIAVKGIRQGLLIHLGQGHWEQRLEKLAERLQAGSAFFQGGQAALDAGELELNIDQVQQVRDLMRQYGVELRALLSTCDTTILSAVHSGLAPGLQFWDTPQEPREPVVEPEPSPAGGLVLERSVRSGQRIEHATDVVIFGDVHAGAEVIAGGHVIVWGKLHGMVHAGAMGNDKAVVCALDLDPTQLRIAGHIARPPEELKEPAPEMARVRDGRMEAISWQVR